MQEGPEHTAVLESLPRVPTSLDDKGGIAMQEETGGMIAPEDVPDVRWP